MIKDLPEGLTKYYESPIFDEETLPHALQKGHKTKAGCWAKAIITEGAIGYVLKERPEEILTLSAGEFVIIEPEVPHHVEVTGPVKFQLEFYKMSV